MKRIVFALALVALGTAGCKKANQSGMSADSTMMADSMHRMADSMHRMSDSMKRMDTTRH